MEWPADKQYRHLLYLRFDGLLSAWLLVNGMFRFFIFPLLEGIARGVGARSYGSVWISLRS